VEDNGGDTWVAAWADDDRLYTPSDDTDGFHKAAHANIVFNRLDGPDPQRLTGLTVNPMKEYGKATEEGPDQCSWKSSGCTFVDGALYWVVARHCYGEKSGDPRRRQTAQNASIIKSTDYGLTWTRSAMENYQHPMFPGRRFATPYFIEYGRNRADVDGAPTYVYAVSNNGFWDCGDDMILGRVLRSKLSALSGADWEFFTGGDGMLPSAWTHKADTAKPLIQQPGRLGMTGAVYAAEELVRRNPRHFMPQQFLNPANPDIHRRTTAREILKATDGHIDAFVAGVGTGGTITGVGETLKLEHPTILVVAVEPARSPVLQGGKFRQHAIQGIGASFVPGVLNTKVYDEIIGIRDEEALATTRRLAREEGLLVGVSSGAHVCAALRVAERLGRGKTVVTMLCDTGERYLSVSM
jgi:hypothetical protein